MADLLLYIPNHGYSNTNKIYVSWLDGNYYVSDKDANSFKIVVTSGGTDYVAYSEDITDGFVRQVTVSGVTTISDLGHLEGETVKLTSGGNVVATEVVSGGEITTSSTVFTYQVGLPYKMKVRTMRLSVPQEGNTLQTRIKRIHETVVRYVRSKLGKAGQEYGGTEYLSELDTTFSTRSQDVTKPTEGGFSEDAYTVVTSDDPVPFTVLATIISFEVEERR